MSYRNLLLLLPLLSHAAVVQSQDLPVGERIKVIFPDSSMYIGRLDSAQASRIWLTSEPAEVRVISLSRFDELQVSRGRKPKFLLGAELGAVIGLASSLVIKNIVEKDVASDDKLPAGLYVGVGIAGGALVGLGLSVAAAPERWETVPHPAQP